MKDLKDLIAYIVPLLCIIGIRNGGLWLYLTPVVIFSLVPALELAMPSLRSNLNKTEKDRKLKNKYFDSILWLNVPIIYAVLLYGLY